jgi:hypothetical protein
MLIMQLRDHMIQPSGRCIPSRALGIPDFGLDDKWKAA